MERITHGVRTRLRGVDVRLGYLDLNSPGIADVLACCTGQVLVAPLLLSDAFHSKVDLPAIVADACAANPDIEVRQLPPLGDDPRIVSALIGRLDQAGFRATDGIVLTAVGSSDPTADEAVQTRAAELAARLRTPLIQTVFATRLGKDHSNLHHALRSLRRSGARRVVVSPYFLSAGLLTERVDAAVDHLAPGSLIAGPIGAHPDLIDVVCDRYVTIDTAVPATFSALT